jgi:hypothetical protein
MSAWLSPRPSRSNASCCWNAVSLLGQPNFTPRSLARFRPSLVLASDQRPLELRETTENREHQLKSWDLKKLPLIARTCVDQSLTAIVLELAAGL